jgi:ceramide glucosyltransferase
MTIAIWAAEAFCILSTAVHLTSTTIAALRCRPIAAGSPARDRAPGVSLVRPVCGIDNFIEETLRSGLELDYPDYEIIFCVAAAHDPVIQTIESLIAAYPCVTARLLIGNEPISDNPKLNNVYKGWRAAAHEWIIFADSNVFMPPDYIGRLLAAWRPDTGLICSPPIGCRPVGFWAELECAFLNTFQARFQYAADTLGLGFAQGKTMLWKRSLLEQSGGLRSLAAELAEDAAATKVVRAAGLRVRLVDAPFEQPLGDRSAGDVWRRQVRWARLRRASFTSCYVAELLTGGAWPLAAAAFAAAQTDLPLAGPLALAIVWYGSEAVLAWAAAWHLTARSPLAWILRDLLLPLLWISGWLGNAFVWRGNHMRMIQSRSAT